MNKLPVAFLIYVLHICPAFTQPQQTPAISSDSISRDCWHTFAQYIEDAISNNNIPGLSIAIVNRESILWAHAFGLASKKDGTRLSPETVFSLQSVSKAITATAVLFAVQEGLVSLDTPITSYLPDFKVNSRFEKEPQRKMTLRHLLSHRAGFTHEAPIGNNYQTDFESFEQHIKSISNTWLRAPVGEAYFYSNLGIDLAGYILQERAGMPFAEYVKTRLFTPLEMQQSSFDWQVINNQKNRAIGHSKDFQDIPLEYAMIPSGACYTNVLDMANFLRFHLNRGRYKDQLLLEEEYLQEMYRIPALNQTIGYALGIEIIELDEQRWFRHGGGGFGFLTGIQWQPDLDIGLVILTNSSDHKNIHWKIAEYIMHTLISQGVPATQKKNVEPKSPQRALISLTEKQMAMFSGTYISPDDNQIFQVSANGGLFGARLGNAFMPFQFISPDGGFFVQGFGPEYDGEYKIFMDPQNKEPLYILNKAGRVVLFFNGHNEPAPGTPKPEWAGYVGTYARKMYGQEIATHEIVIKNGSLYLDTMRLKEYLPGLFFAANGEAVDFREKTPSYRNIMLFKKDP
jgi:CubicO group peptidase (beta-lactamase class C family)